MGEIYVAEDRELGRQVAIKVLHERFAEEAQLRHRFSREALAAARLSGHPHVITIYDVGEWAGRAFIVMEYLPGGTVAERARSGPISSAEALEWLGQAAEALDAAHELGVIHRDVKPANLLFDARGHIVVADFGIARVADETTGMTAAGTVLGTAGYLAPEQALGQPATEASDRYALAVVAYELLTGQRPFVRSSTTAEAAAHIHEPVPRASERGVGLPPAVDDIFERALAKVAADRYPSAASFVADLRQALEAPAATKPFSVMPTAIVVRRPELSVERGRQRLLPALLGAALSLALVGGAAAALLTTGGDTSATTTVARQHEVTVTREVTKTAPGDTVTETIVTTLSAPPTTPVRATAPSAAGAHSIDEAVVLTDQATYALGRGDWTEAERLARQAYASLSDTYADGFRYEAYVNYDLGKALAELGRCQQALRFLDRSEELQGKRMEIDSARARCGA
jgi:hypothetical protein